MIIKPKIRGFICTTAHPDGCFKAVEEQIEYIKSQTPFSGPKNVLVIGASTGYGLASRIAATFGADAKTIGIFYEKPAEGERTASAGWYNSAAFEQIAHHDGHYAKSIKGDELARHEIAKSMLKRGVEIDLIMEDTGLKREKIEKILKFPRHCKDIACSIRAEPYPRDN
ncbi:MAG: hypothetical protein A3F46_06785 [Legionellales bacterium RIFCSPHIGHO2_12_FULL_42_9]|nr:MAG: hypothetical protein A3F46_06785 [Legionellales bacterium RIFCSPHIGHO2_12_FULL_42_9]